MEAWVPMRVCLSDDPKVIAMVEFLQHDEGFWLWCIGVREGQATWEPDADKRDGLVTCHITECCVVASLLRIWGAVRAHGECDSEDMILRNSTLDTVEKLGKVASISLAMVHVGWLIEGETSLRFPKFLKMNIPREERQRIAARERQRKHRVTSRDGERDITCDKKRDCHALKERKVKERTLDDDPPLEEAVLPPTEPQFRKGPTEYLDHPPAAGEVARLGFSPAKADEICRQTGIQPGEAEAWREFERANGTPAMLAAVQVYRRPVEVPPRVVRPEETKTGGRLGRSSSLNDPRKFDGRD